MAFRYFVYVSKSKVDLLYDQIPETALSRIATTLTIDLKLLKAEFSAKDSQRSLYSKVDIIERYLNEEGVVGTVDDPKAFFRGEMPLRWGPYGGGFELDEDFVYFGGWTERTLLGLGGSTKHVIGHEGTSYASSHSATPYLVEALRRELMSNDFDVDEAEAATVVELATTQMKGMFQEMEFLAKRLAVGHASRYASMVDRGERPLGLSGPKERTLLGTPIYVALLD
jgi:hypothetical protein